MKKPPINHYRQRRLTKVFLEENFNGEELVFEKLIYGCRMDYSYNLIVILRMKRIEGSNEVQSKINERINDYVKNFGLIPHSSPLKIRGDEVKIDYFFSDIEYHNYKNEFFLDLEEFLQDCSDSHLEDETEIPYSPVYKLFRSIDYQRIEIRFREFNDLKEMEKFSTLFVQMLTNSVISGKLEIRNVGVEKHQIRVLFIIVVKQ